MTTPQVPRLPRKTRHQSQPSAPSATPATQNEGGCHQVPRLPRKTKVDVAKCHACHAKSGDQARDQVATRASPVPQVPRLPRKTSQNEGRCHQVPRLPLETKVGCHACHAEWRAPGGHQARAQARHQSQPSVASATPATQNEGRCHQVPRLPRKVVRRPGDQACPSAPPEPAQCRKRHACHAKRRQMSPSATPATRNQGGCHQVPRLPRKVVLRPGRPSACPSAPPEPAQCRKCHACHAKQRQMSPSATPATPATRNQGGCHQV